MKFLRKINLEINKDLYNPIQVKQGDNSRYLLFNLLDNGVPFSLENKTVRVYGLKPDGTKVFNNLTIINAARGLAELLLTTQMLVKPGCLKLELVIYEATDILSTTKFDIDIISCIRDDGAIESTNEFSALTVALAKADEYGEALKQGTENIELIYATELNGVKSSLEEVANNKVDKVSGMGLSKNSYEDNDKNNVAIIPTLASLSYVDTKIGNMGNTKTFKGSCLYSALPSSATVDDYWYVTDRKTNFCWNGTSWVDIGDNLNIGEKTVAPEMTTFFTPSKNLFNKETVTKGYYVKWDTGKLVANANSSASEFIDISHQKVFYLNNRNQVAFYNENKDYVSGLVGVNKFERPEDVKYVRLTVTTSLLDTTQLEVGDSFTGYEPYMLVIDEYFLPNKSSGNSVIVKNNEANAITNAISKHYSGRPLVFLIYPGTYEESVDIRGKKISLVGLDKETCIIKNYLNDYYNPPVNMSGQDNHVSNLTCISDKNESSPIRLGSYGIHCDATITEEGGRSTINNCRIISKQNVGLGMGTKNKQTIEVTDCDIESWEYEGVFCHNYPLSGATKQKIVFKNNHIVTHAEGRGAIRIADSNNRVDGGNDNRDTTLAFYNNILYSTVNGKDNLITKDKELDESSFCGYIKLEGDCWGNNAPELNK